MERRSRAPATGYPARGAASRCRHSPRTRRDKKQQTRGEVIMSAAVAPVQGSRFKLVFFLVFAALTVFVTYMKNPGFFDPTSPVAQHFAPGLGFLLVHGFFGMVALALGALQLSNRLRARHLALHRKLGYVYVVSVFIAAPMAIMLSTRIGTASLLGATIVQ